MIRTGLHYHDPNMGSIREYRERRFPEPLIVTDLNNGLMLPARLAAERLCHRSGDVFIGGMKFYRWEDTDYALTAANVGSA